MFQLSLDHIRIAAPPGCEAVARSFYCGVLGLEEMERPEPLRHRGGCWFRCGAHQIHIGVEAGFQPARKAHPAFAVSDLDSLRARLAAEGFPTIDDESLPGVRRFYSADPWGNRIEFLEKASSYPKPESAS